MSGGYFMVCLLTSVLQFSAAWRRMLYGAAGRFCT